MEAYNVNLECQKIVVLIMLTNFTVSRMYSKRIPLLWTNIHHYSKLKIKVTCTKIRVFLFNYAIIFLAQSQVDINFKIFSCQVDRLISNCFYALNIQRIRHYRTKSPQISFHKFMQITHLDLRFQLNLLWHKVEIIYMAYMYNTRQ